MRATASRPIVTRTSSAHPRARERRLAAGVPGTHDEDVGFGRPHGDLRTPSLPGTPSYLPMQNVEKILSYRSPDANSP